MNPVTEGVPACNLIPAEAKRLRNKVLDYIRSCGTIGSTCEEAEVTLGLPHQTVSARLTELQRERLIRKATRPGTRMDEAPVPVKRKTRTGRNAQVWIACD
jgi:predicted transcriptional regulator